MSTRAALILLLAATVLPAGCARSRPPDPVDVFGINGAETVLRPGSDAERARIAERAAFLHKQYGYVPDGSLRDLRGLRDLLDRPDIGDRLSREPTLSFGNRLRNLGYRFRPTDAQTLIDASSGPAGEALADPEVSAFLSRPKAEDLLLEYAASEGRRKTPLSHLPAGEHANRRAVLLGGLRFLNQLRLLGGMAVMDVLFALPARPT